MHRFTDILCIVGSGTGEDTAFARAAEIAEHNNARLLIAKVVDKFPSATRLENKGLAVATVMEKLRAQHQQELEGLAQSLPKSIEVQVKVIFNTPFLGVIQEVLKGPCDLVIKAADPGGLLDRLFGSDDMHLLRKCPCPVWLINPVKPGVNKCIVAAVDIGDIGTLKETEETHELNRQILEMALSLATTERAELHILHVWEAIGADILSGPAGLPRAEVDTYVTDLQQEYQRDLDLLVDGVMQKTKPHQKNIPLPQTHLIQGVARREIPNFVEKMNADTVVMGTVCRTGITGYLMGNTAETILNQLSSSLIAVKPSGFKTPVTLDH